MKNFELNINGKKIPLKNIDEFSFKEFNKVKSILNSDIQEEDKYKELLGIFTDLSPVIIDKIKNLYVVNFVEIFNQQTKINKIPIELDDLKLQDLNLLTIGKFIDMEFFLTQSNIEIEKIVALMYLDNDYVNEFEDTVKLVYDNIKATTGNKILELFVNFRTNFYKNYEGLFNSIPIEEDKEEPKQIDNEEEEEEEEDLTNSWGLTEYVYHLSDGDILKVDEIHKKGLFEVFNYLTWQKEQTDKANQKQKQRNNNI